MGNVIDRQPWISVYSNTGPVTDIILSLNIQQECIHFLIIVEKIFFVKMTIFFFLHIVLKVALFYMQNCSESCIFLHEKS
jgi:hypothetical protein